MVQKSSVDESSERKRISIPRADESVLAWWEAQKEPALSIRILIRDEIRRSGYTDTAYRLVAQLPGEIIDAPDGADGRGLGAAVEPVLSATRAPATRAERRAAEAEQPGVAAAVEPVLSATRAPATRAERRAAEAEQLGVVTGVATPTSSSTIDDLMNG